MSLFSFFIKCHTLFLVVFVLSLFIHCPPPHRYLLLLVLLLYGNGGRRALYTGQERESG